MLQNTLLTKVQIYKWGWDQKKKSKKNPQGKRIPSIDEFGGYCKFDQREESPKLTKIVDIDWNEQIRLLDLDCAKEEKINHAKPESIVKKELQIQNSVKEKQNVNKEVTVQAKKVESNEKSFSTPMKKFNKRDRYCSDLTNASNSARNLLITPRVTPPKSSAYVTPFFEEDFDRDYSFENVNYENFEYFGSSGFMYPPEKVSKCLLLSLILIVL